MTKKDRAMLAEGFRRLIADLAVIAGVLGDEVPGQKDPAPPEVPAVQEASPAPPAENTPEPGRQEEMKAAGECTREEARTVLAEKARSGFRAEVKAILTRHGVNQLSDVKDPAELYAIRAEAEEIGIG